MPSEAAETRLLERRVFVCVPVPGESAWLQASETRPQAPSFPPAASARPKRGRAGESDDDVSMSIAESVPASAAGASGDVSDTLDSKRVRPHGSEARQQHRRPCQSRCHRRFVSLDLIGRAGAAQTAGCPAEYYNVNYC